VNDEAGRTPVWAGDGARLPAHLEVSGLVRQVNSAGGFATVLASGERDAGTIMLITCCNGKDYRVYERFPQASGQRHWLCVRESGEDLPAFIEQRRKRDSDLWIVELDIAQAERFIGLPSATD